MGDHRGRSRAGSASSRRARWPARLLGQARDPVLAAAAHRPAAARRPEGRPVRAAPRRAQRREAGAATRTGSCSPSTCAPGVLRKQIRHRDRPRAPRPARDPRARSTRLAQPQRPRPRLPAAADRPARAALAQLLDAQRPAADARRAHARGPDPSRRRRARSGSRTASAAGSARPHGEIELAAKVTDEVKRRDGRGPARLGPPGGWQIANAAGGANVNLLASSDPADLERLAGMAHLNGIPIRVEAVATAPAGERALAEPAPVA